jgi:hypothetical protein
MEAGAPVIGTKRGLVEETILREKRAKMEHLVKQRELLDKDLAELIDTMKIDSMKRYKFLLGQKEFSGIETI